MSKVAKQRRQANEPLVFVRKLENIAQRARYVEYAEGMVKPGMESTGINHIRHRGLANSAKSLKRGGFNDLRFVT